MLKNSHQRYGAVSIVLHWVTALGVFTLFPLGLWMVELDYYDAWYHKAPDLHKSIGILLFVLVALRLGWRWINPQPVPLGIPLENRLAALAQRLLYLLLFALTASGYLISTAEGHAIAVFGWFEVPATLHDLEGQADVAGEIHELLAFSLMGLVVLHAGAALKHHFVNRDATLGRMLGARPQSADRTKRNLKREELT